MVVRSTSFLRATLTAAAVTAATLAPSAALGQSAGTEKEGSGKTDTEAARPPQAETPARTPLPDVARKPLPAWQKHFELGGDVALVTRPSRPSRSETDGRQAGIAYRPTVGFGIHASWALHRYLRFQGYFLDARHTVTMPRGALGLPGTITPRSSVYTYSFGARLSPTLPLSDRARVYATVGVGWGRFEFDKMDVEVGGQSGFVVRQRSNAFVEFPMGLGAAFEILPGVPGLTAQIEVTGAFCDAEDGGSAVNEFQTIDAAGRKTNVGPLPEATSSFVQTLGLSLSL